MLQLNSLLKYTVMIKASVNNNCISYAANWILNSHMIVLSMRSFVMSEIRYLTEEL